MLRRLLDNEAPSTPTTQRQHSAESLRLDLSTFSKAPTILAGSTPPESPTSRVSCCKHCKQSFYALYSSGGTDFCGKGASMIVFTPAFDTCKDCETCFMWYKPKTPTSVTSHASNRGFNEAKLNTPSADSPRNRVRRLP